MFSWSLKKLGKLAAAVVNFKVNFAMAGKLPARKKKLLFVYLDKMNFGKCFSSVVGQFLLVERS